MKNDFVSPRLSINDYLSLLPEYCGECRYYSDAICYRYPPKTTKISDYRGHLQEVHKGVITVTPIRLACGEGLLKYREINLNDILDVIRENNFISTGDFLSMGSNDDDYDEKPCYTNVDGKTCYHIEVKLSEIAAPLCTIKATPIPSSNLTEIVVQDGYYVPAISTKEASEDVELIVMMILLYIRAAEHYSFKERADIECLIDNYPIIAGLCDVKYEKYGIRIQFLDR